MNIYDIFKELHIEYKEIEHPAVFTIEESKLVDHHLGGIGCKNLLLTDRHREHFFLVLLEQDKRADTKAIARLVGVSRLVFANADELADVLGLFPGSVSPFGIINDTENRATVIIDEALIGGKLQFHPNINTRTVLVDYNDLIRFIEFEEHQYMILPDTSTEESTCPQ